MAPPRQKEIILYSNDEACSFLATTIAGVPKSWWVNFHSRDVSCILQELQVNTTKCDTRSDSRIYAKVGRPFNQGTRKPSPHEFLAYVLCMTAPVQDGVVRNPSNKVVKRLYESSWDDLVWWFHEKPPMGGSLIEWESWFSRAVKKLWPRHVPESLPTPAAQFFRDIQSIKVTAVDEYMIHFDASNVDLDPEALRVRSQLAEDAQQDEAAQTATQDVASTPSPPFIIYDSPCATTTSQGPVTGPPQPTAAESSQRPASNSPQIQDVIMRDSLPESGKQKEVPSRLNKMKKRLERLCKKLEKRYDDVIKKLWDKCEGMERMMRINESDSKHRMDKLEERIHKLEMTRPRGDDQPQHQDVEREISDMKKRLDDIEKVLAEDEDDEVGS